jgi:hypothetical protein
VPPVLHAFITFAAEAAPEESSKTAFYIAGGLLAGWAVLVSLLGISRSDEFPGSDSAAMGIVGITVVLVLGATATAVLTG